jgi:hypothetical protein
VNNVAGLHALVQVCVEVAKEVPPTVTSRLHGDRGRLTWVDGHDTAVELIHDNVVAMPVDNMGVEAHVPQIPDNIVILAHIKGGVVGIYVAVDLHHHSGVSVDSFLLFLMYNIGFSHTGKKLGAASVVTLVSGELIICGYQKDSFPPVVIRGYVEDRFANIDAPCGRYFWTFCRAKKELDSWLSP